MTLFIVGKMNVWLYEAVEVRYILKYNKNGSVYLLLCVSRRSELLDELELERVLS